MTISSSTWIRGSVVGIALGGGYALFPMSVWFVAVMAGLFAWAGTGLGERERRYVWGVLLAAVAIRLLAVLALFLISEPNVISSFFWDGDGVYLKTRAATIRAVWIGDPVSPVALSRAFDHGYGWSSFIYVLAYLQYLIGPAPYGVHLFNILAFVASSILMHRLVRPAFGRVPALLGLGLMLFLPTLLAWSVSALKESFYLMLNVVALAAAAAVVRSARWVGRVSAVVVIGMAVVANATVRNGAGGLMLASLGAGVSGTILSRRWWILLLAAVLLPLAAARLMSDPDRQAKVLSQIDTAAVLHRGAVLTVGGTYSLLEPVQYLNRQPIAMTPAEARRYVARALLSFVVVPLPWQVGSKAELLFLAQQVIWYLLLLCAAVGFAAGLRRDALLTWMLCGFSLVGAGAIALSNGNIGSLVRFRDTITPFVVWLSALGAVSVAAECLSRASAGREAVNRWTDATIEGPTP